MRDYETKYEAGDLIYSDDIGYGLVLGHDFGLYGPEYCIYWLSKDIGLTKPSVYNVDSSPRCSPVWENKTRLVQS